MEDISNSLDTLRCAHAALLAIIAVLDGAGEPLIAAQLSTTLDTIEARLGSKRLEPSMR